MNIMDEVGPCGTCGRGGLRLHESRRFLVEASGVPHQCPGRFPPKTSFTEEPDVRQTYELPPAALSETDTGESNGTA